MTIQRLEPTQQFVDRIVILNRFHTPDEDDYSGAHNVLGQIHRGFPDGDVEDQAAYLITSIVQDKPFAEANFRTAWDYVSDMLWHREYDLRATYAEVQELANTVWDLEPEATRDYLADWFQPRIHSLKGAILN